MERPTDLLDEYQKLVNRINTPRVVIDNAACGTATVVKVDSALRRGILFEAVVALADLNVDIRKAYISNDGHWFMDVFHVTDDLGRKLADDSITSYIQHSLSGITELASPRVEKTVLELAGTDRPGLLSEVFAILADLQCSIVDAKVWTHNGRIALLISIKQVEDSLKLRRVELQLRNVMKSEGDLWSAKIAVNSASVGLEERRLHQMMVEGRDYEWPMAASFDSISIQNWADRGYSIVNVEYRDRPKLLFDVVCTLTDLDYVVFHGTVDTDGDRARQEFYIKHVDGSPISSEAERQRVIQCLQAAVDRRSSEGVKLELCAEDRPGLLANVTRAFRENGLLVTRAEISTKDGMASNVFYVKEEGDGKAIEAVRETIGVDYLKVWQPPLSPSECHKADGGVAGLFSFGNLVKRNLFNLGLIRSCS